MEELLFIGNLLKGLLPAVHGCHLFPMSESGFALLTSQAGETKASETRGHSVNTQGSPVDVGSTSGGWEGGDSLLLRHKEQ